MAVSSRKSTSNGNPSAQASLSADEVMDISNSDQVHSILSNTQNINDEEDDTSMYINLPPADDSNEEGISHSQREQGFGIGAGQQYSTSNHQSVDPALQDPIKQAKSSNSFDSMDIDIKEEEANHPTSNEVAAAVAAAEAAGDLSLTNEEQRNVNSNNRNHSSSSSNDNNNTSIQQDANSAMVTAAAAAAAKVAAAAAADSSQESDADQHESRDNEQEMELDSSPAQPENTIETQTSRPQLTKHQYLEDPDNSQIRSSNDSDSYVSPASKPKPSISSLNENNDYTKNAVRPWPIDKPVSEAEFQNVPPALRESLAQSSEFANGLTYISHIEPESFPTKADAVKYLKTFASTEGFELKTLEAESSATRLVFGCAHTQQGLKTSLNSLKRSRTSFSANSESLESCPFQVIISLSQVAESWDIESSSPEHNHGPTGPAASAKRRRLTHFQKTLRDDFLLPKALSSTSKSTHTYPLAPTLFNSGSSYNEDQSSTQTQTHNGKKVDNLRGLVGALRFDNAYVMDRLDKNGSVTHLFWTNQDCMDMLQLFPEVLFINVIRDSKSLPLVHIVGMTCFNTTFEVGYGYLKTYALEGLVWVMNSLKEIATKALQSQKAYQPSAVIIHQDLQLMGAVELQFEGTCQFCVSHLMRDVNEQAAAFFTVPEERKKFIKKFQKLVDSETADIYAFNEAGFRKDYQGTKILEYVTYHWLQQKTRFVRAWVDQHLHFNNYSMGKAEIVQATVATYVRECEGDVLKLYHRLSKLLKRKKEAYDILLKEQQEKCPLKFFVPFFDDVRFQISTHALELIKEQHELYLETQSVKEPLSRCTSMFTNTTGLPCKHTLARPVTMDDIHPHWWLHKQKHYRVPLSAHERKSIEISSKFERTLSLAKQHFHNMVSVDMKEMMLFEAMKYFTSIGVSGMDEINTSASKSVTKSSPMMIPRAGSPLTSPSISTRHILSGSVSPSLASGRVSTPTTNLHKNSVNGLMSPAHHALLNSSLVNSISHAGAGVSGANNSESFDESTDNSSLSMPNLPSSMYLNLRGSHYSNGSGDAHSNANANTPIMSSPALSGAETGSPHMSTHGGPQSSDSSTGNTQYQTRSTVEFNELAAVAAAAAAAEHGVGHADSSSNGTAGDEHTGAHNMFKGVGNNNSYPASIANIMNSPNPGLQHQPSGGYYSKSQHQNRNLKKSLNSQQFHQQSAQGHHAHHHGQGLSGASRSTSTVTSSPLLLMQQQRDLGHNIGLQDSSNNGVMQISTPRKCGKCNQIGHNSRTCGQRISLDGL